MNSPWTCRGKRKELAVRRCQHAMIVYRDCIPCMDTLNRGYMVNRRGTVNRGDILNRGDIMNRVAGVHIAQAIKSRGGKGIQE